jgi:hypothetical protein
MFFALVVAAVAAAPQPTASPLRTIIHEHVAPLCATLKSNVFLSIQGLRINDKLVENANGFVLQMGRDFSNSRKFASVKSSQLQTMWGNTAGAFSNEYSQNPALQFDAQHLMQVSSDLAQNLEKIDKLLADPSKFPSEAKTLTDRQALDLKQQLQRIADAQRQALNTIYGLADTYELQALIARGDQTSGAINAGGNANVSHDEQQVTFQDPISGPERGRRGSREDPATAYNDATIRAEEATHNPFVPYVLSVVRSQGNAQAAEDDLTPLVYDAVNVCK